MKCPHCHEEIAKVIVNSMCFQTGHLKEYIPGLWGIEDYGDDITVEETVNLQCPECMEILDNVHEDMYLYSDAELRKMAQNLGNVVDLSEGDFPL